MKKNNYTFIKVLSPDVASKLVALGFHYTLKERGAFVFEYDDDIFAALKEQFGKCNFVCENKLRF